MSSHSNNSSVAIDLKELSKTYRSGFWMRPFVALKSLSLQVEPGEAFGFVGPNGAGKTTTIKILAGLQEATSGSAHIFGQSVTDPSSRFQLGFLPERPYFYTHLTAREVLNFYGSLYEIPQNKRSSKIEELLNRTDMLRFGDIKLGQYSKGMLQRIGLCQTLLHEPKVIVLDEPMSGLDPIGRALVRDVILEEKQKGTTIFFSSHVLSDVESICSRVAVLVGGELRGVGTLSELMGTDDRQVDITLKGDVSEQIKALGTVVYERGELVCIRCVKEIRSELVLRSSKEQLDIVEITPVRMNLEAFLVDEIQKELPLDERKMGVLA